jgi:uncharacterized protein YdaT
MADRKTYHVLHEEGDWKVKLEASNRASGTFDNKEDAVERARELAQREEKAQVIVHRRDNTIENEFTYGRDPRDRAS